MADASERTRRAARPYPFFLLGLGLLACQAQAEPMDFNVPAQPADSALLLFSRQAKSEMLFSFDDLHQVQSTAVTGRLEPATALRRLLQGTGFTARSNRRENFVITRAHQATGSIKGRLLTPDNLAARDILVSIPGTHQAATTDENGEFDFTALPPATYQLVAVGAGYQPLQITSVHVEAGRVLTLAAQALHRADDPGRMAPFIVEGRSTRPLGFGPGDNSLGPPTAVGNLDLTRTEDDVMPYAIYGREQIARSGLVNLNEFIQRNVLDSDAATRPPEQNPGSDIGTNGFQGGSTNLKLRGFGPDETIVLVNGRRLPEVLASTPNSTQIQQPDVNFIPLSLVQRVEVLPISAAAVYSGNAVGGVINIVLRPDVNTTEVTATYTNALRGFDAPQSTVSFQHGQTLLQGKLHVRLNATLTEAMPPTEAELGYIKTYAAAHSGPATILYRATPNIRSADGSPLFGAGTPAVTSVAPGADGSGGLAAFTGRQGVRNLALFDPAGGMANSADSVDFPYGRHQRGHSYFGSATYEALPWLQVGLDGIYTHTVTNRGYNVFRGDLVLSGAATSNPFHQDIDVSLNEITSRLGENYSEAHLDFSSVVLGLLVRLPADWQLTLDSQYGRSLIRYRGLVGVDPTRWQQLVDQGLYNPLRDTQVTGPPAAFYDRALKYYGGPGRFVAFGNYDALDSALRISNQALMLPTGRGVVNFGGDYRRNHLAPYTSEQRYGDGSLVDFPVRLSGRTLQRLSAFAEVQAPLVPVRWLPDWIREIQTDLAVRYVAANSAQETNTAPTGGLKFDLANGFSFRATVATSNRLPPPNLSGKATTSTPSEPVIGSGDVSYVKITDPLRNNEENDKVLASDALNANLHPESAVTWTTGLMFRRGQVHQFRAILDFTDTRKSGELTALVPQAVVNLESVFPGRVIRAPLAPDDPNTVGPVTSVFTGVVNLAYRHSQNWSTSLDYAWTECLGGRLELYGRWLYFQRYDLQLLPSTPVVNELAHPDGNAPQVLRHRVNFGAGWSDRDYSFGLDGHYFHSRILPLGEQPDQGSDRIDSAWQFDAYVQNDLARWLPWKNPRFGLRGQLRVNNLFNTSAPRYDHDPSGTGVQTYGDWRGRVYSLSVTATF